MFFESLVLTAYSKEEAASCEEIVSWLIWEADVCIVTPQISSA